MSERAVKQSRESLSSRVKYSDPAVPPGRFYRRTPEGTIEPGLAQDTGTALSLAPAVAGLATPFTSGMPLSTAVRTVAGGIAGSTAGAYGGGHAGHYLGGILGRLLNNKKMEQQGAGIGETVGAIGGGLVGGYGGGAAASRGGGIPLKLRLGGVPIEGEMPLGGAGRVGSAGDLASWDEENLWAGYMKNQNTPQGQAIAREIQRRGLARSPAGTYRPPNPPTQGSPAQGARGVDTGGTGGAGGPSPVSQSPTNRPAPGFKPGAGIAANRGDMPKPQPSISQPELIQQMQDAITHGTLEEKAMAMQRLREMGVEPLEKFKP